MNDWQNVFWPRFLGYAASCIVILVETGVGRWEVWAFLGWLLSLPPALLWLRSPVLRRWLGWCENLLVPLTAFALALPGALIAALAFALLLGQLGMAGVRRAAVAALLMATGLIPAVLLAGWPVWVGSALAAGMAGIFVACYALYLAALANWQRRRLVAIRQRLAGQARRHAELADRLARYLPPAVYRVAFDQVAGPVQRSQRRWLTVCFIDLVGFTAKTEHLDSEDVVGFLDEFYALIADAAMTEGGTLDKFIGDAAMVFFGEPQSDGREADAAACLRMALQIRRRFAVLQRAHGHGRIAAALALRMGMHSGWCTVGSIGKEARLEYTIIGTTVNLASRLEAAAAPDEIRLSAETAGLLVDQQHCLESLGLSEIRGFSRPVRTFRYVAAATRPLRWQRPGLQLELDPGKVEVSDLEQLLSELRGLCGRDEPATLLSVDRA